MKKLQQLATICLLAAVIASCDKDSNNMPEKGYSIKSYYTKLNVTSPDITKYPQIYTQTNKKVSLMTSLETANHASLEIQSFIIYNIDRDGNGDNDVSTMLSISNIPQNADRVYESSKLPLTMVFTTTVDMENGSTQKSYERIPAEALNISILQENDTIKAEFDLYFNSENAYAEQGATFKISAVIE